MLLRTFAVSAVAVLCASAPPHAQAPAAEDWSLTYSIMGGIAGISRRMTVTSSGRLQLDDRRIGRLDVPAPPDLVIRVRDLVATPREIAQESKAPAHPDQMITTLSLTSDGRTREVEPTPEVVNALTRAADVAVWQTLVGKWRQAGWTSCTPAARRDPGEVDPAIDELALNGDSTFWVRWPEGPQAAGQYVAMPGYTGRFRAVLLGGGIEFTLEDDAEAPRDFAGRGTFRFDGERLTLGGIWFGTRQASRKPDICEIEFARR